MGHRKHRQRTRNKTYQPYKKSETVAQCPDCGGGMIWRTSPQGKRVAVDIEGGAHLRTCPASGRKARSW